MYEKSRSSFRIKVKKFLVYLCTDDGSSHLVEILDQRSHDIDNPVKEVCLGEKEKGRLIGSTLSLIHI